MIFQRALRREMVSAAGATFTVLFTVLLTWTLIRILGKAAGGKVASGDVVALIAFAALDYLPFVLILTSFISVLAVVTRTYRDSEMVVWFASGQSLVKWIRPVLAFGLPMVVLTAVLSLVVTPWAKGKSEEFVERFEKREDLQKVSPGQFRESSKANRIFFVEGAGGQRATVQNVFVNTFEGDANTVVVAKEAVIEQDHKGDNFLVLKNGRRYHGTPGQADFQTMEFERYSMRVNTQVPALNAKRPVVSMSTPALLADGGRFAEGEFQKRIAMPITCLILLLLAIPLGFVNPRAGSSVNLIIALLIFFTYNNLNKTIEAMVKQGKASFGLSWWPMHLAMALVVLALFAWRLNVNHRWHPMALVGAYKRRGIAKRTKA
jgi:lipopolysaccharide export system permease protein